MPKTMRNELMLELSSPAARSTVQALLIPEARVTAVVVNKGPHVMHYSCWKKEEVGKSPGSAWVCLWTRCIFEAMCFAVDRS